LKEEKILILEQRVRELTNKLSYLDQLRPLVKSDTEGWMRKISFEQMSEYAVMWMKREGKCNEL